MVHKDIADLYKLSPIQEGMLFHTLSAPTSGVYVEQFTKRSVRVDAGLWEQAWNYVIDRQPILRTSFFWERLEKPVQVVRLKAGVTLTQMDWSHLSAAEQEACFEQFLQTDRLTSFDLTKAPLMRLALIQVAADQWHFVWTYHHILLDGWSAFLVIDEVFDTYDALREGRSLSLRPAPAYKRYLAWLQQQDQQQAEHFWQEYLHGFSAPTTLGLVEKPGWSGASTGNYTILRHRLSDAVADSLRSFAKQARLTLSTVFQGAWAYVLSVYSGDTDVLFGSTVSGRPTTLEGVESMVGLFINTLPTRVRLDPQATVSNWLKHLQQEQVAVRNFEFSSLVQIHGWSSVPRGVPLFDSMLAVESFPASKHGELTEVMVAQQTNYPLTLVVEPSQCMTIKAMFDPQRYDPQTITALLTHFQEVLVQFTQQGNRPIGGIRLLSQAEEREQDQWNAIHVDYPRRDSLKAWFERIVAMYPERTAVVVDSDSLTYGELNRRSNLVAQALLSHGAIPGRQVALLMEPSLDLVIALVAIVKIGCAYTPLDPQSPIARLTSMVKDLTVPHLLSHRGLAEGLQGGALRILYMEQCATGLAYGAEMNPAISVDTDTLLYIIHTSGSTGKPKAAGVFHHSFAHFMRWWVSEFGFTPQDQVLLVNKVTFDLSQKNIWGAFLTGGELHLTSSPYFNPTAVRAHIAAHNISWMNCTPSMAYALVEDPSVDFSSLSSLRYLFLGGEPVNKERLAAWVVSPEFCGEVVNTYGPTECTDLCSVHRFTQSEFARLAQPVTVGKALPNIQLYVLDRHLNRLPAGVCGEVVIGGVSVGSGYLNNAAMSADRFLPNSFSTLPGDRLYRTGDLGYFQNDGSVIVKGRVDFQVKVRGYRIELGEIEAALRQHPCVHDAVTIITADDSQQLISYIVLNGIPDSARNEGLPALRETLRRHLSAVLPEYMIPTAYVTLDALPLNVNGKVDRSALPEPGETDQLRKTELLQPRNDYEEKLLHIWRQVLRLEHIGVTDNFFELGGHSLSITQVFSRIPKVFEAQLPLSVLFENPTVERQAQLLAEFRQGGKKHIPLLQARQRPDKLPLSYSQSRLWFLYQYDPDNIAYNVPTAVRFPGPIQLTPLRQALQWLTTRHEALRTYFPIVDGQPLQVIAPTLEPHVRVHDIRDLDRTTRTQELENLATAEALQRFDLQTGPLAHYLLVQMEDEAVLFVTMHHIITDGWSMDIFTRELQESYQAFCQGEQPRLPLLTLQYADFTLWQRELLQDAELSHQLDFWRGELTGSVNTISLPYDATRPPLRTYCGGVVERSLSPALAAQLKALGDANGSTLFMTLLAAFDVLLYRLSGQPDFNVGTPIANRHYEEIEHVMGFFVNTLVLRCQIDGRQTFVELLKTVNKTARDAYDHQDLPFELLVSELQPARSATLNSFFQVIFALQTAYEDTSLISREQWVSRFDIQVTFNENKNVGLTGRWEYDSSLFERKTVEHMAQLFESLVTQLVTQPTMALDCVPLSTTAEAHQETVRWNQMTFAYPREVLIPALFEEQAATRPEAVALSFQGKHLRYGELNAQANQLAHLLQAQGIGENEPVGVSFHRGFDMIVAIVAILKAGGAYVPLDPSYPLERLNFMADDSEIRLLLTQEDVVALLPPLASQVLCLDNLETRYSLQLQSKQNLENVGRLSSSERLAYIMYTSGTTGKPKGVLIPHRGVVRLVKGANYCSLNSTTTLLHCSPVAFDASTFEIWGGLLNGGRVVLYPDNLIDTTRLGEVIQTEGVNTVFLTTGLFNQWMRDIKSGPTGLHYLLSGGEVLSPQAVLKLFMVDPDVQFINCYGPTENTTFSSFFPVPRGFDPSRPVPIGQAVSNTQLYVLDAAARPCPVGVVGELYTGGDGVALGYLKQSALTAERFISAPFPVATDSCLYKTGDVVRRLIDGNIEFFGRVDDQVKIRGFRIEPAEVCAVVNQHPQVQESCVTVIDNEVFGKQLAAYFIKISDSDLTAASLRAFLRQQLPEYMIPSYFIELSSFPLNASGKVDYRCLPPPSTLETQPLTTTPPQSELEWKVWRVWSEILKHEHFGVDDDFFLLGGHSLLATACTTKLQEQFGVRMPLKIFFAEPTVQGVCRYLELVNWVSVDVQHLGVNEEAGSL